MLSTFVHPQRALIQLIRLISVRMNWCPWWARTGGMALIHAFEVHLPKESVVGQDLGRVSTSINLIILLELSYAISMFWVVFDRKECQSILSAPDFIPRFVCWHIGLLIRPCVRGSAQRETPQRVSHCHTRCHLCFEWSENTLGSDALLSAEWGQRNSHTNATSAIAPAGCARICACAALTFLRVR